MAEANKERIFDEFVYVDRGDIVNLAHIMGIKDGIVELKNGQIKVCAMRCARSR